MKILVFTIIFMFFSCSNSEQENSLNSSSELNLVLSKTFGGSLDEKIGGVVKTNDGGMIVVGHTNSADGDINKQYDQIDIWIIKIDSQGNKVWSKTIGGSKNDYGTSIIATNDGNFVISGYTESSDGIVPSNFGLHDFLVVKINSSGEVIWSRNYGFSGHDHAHKIIQTSDGGYFVVGFSEYSGIEGSGGTQNNGEGHEMGHKGVLHGSGEYIGVKIDGQGNFMWYRYFGGTQNDRVNDVVEAIAYNTINIATPAMIYNTFTATAGQTLFTTSNTYTANKIQVSINGVILVNGRDVTVTSGTGFVLATGATLNDRVLAIYPY